MPSSATSASNSSGLPDRGIDSRPSLLVPGRRVRLQGLRSRPELNGCEAIILSWVTASSRFAVSIADRQHESARLAIRPENLACDCVDFRIALGENDELLADTVLPHLDVAHLCELRAVDSRLSSLVRLELLRRPLRWCFQYDWQRTPHDCREALFELAWSRGGFAADGPMDWFGHSTNTRPTRPAELRFRVGDLFQHQSTGCLGYVIGWDERTRAPRQWVEAHRQVSAPGTRYDRLFAPHLSVREFIPDPHAPQGIGFQTRYVIQDSLEHFNPDGIGIVEAWAMQDAFRQRQLQLQGATGVASAKLPVSAKFLWRVLCALHNDSMMLKICVSAGTSDGLKVLGDNRRGGGEDEPALCTIFDALDGAIVPREDGVAPRGDQDLLFRGSARLVPNATLRERYPQDAII